MMDRHRDRRFDNWRGGESYRPLERGGRSPARGGHTRTARSPPRNRSPRSGADTWVPSNSRHFDRLRNRSPVPSRRRSRSPYWSRNHRVGPAPRMRSSPRRHSPRRDKRPPSPSKSFWRSRSPYNGHSRHTSRDGSPPSKRPRDESSSQKHPGRRRDRIASSNRGENTGGLSVGQPSRGTSTRSHSPLRCERRDEPPIEKPFKTSAASPSKRSSTTHTFTQDSATTSQGSITPIHPDNLLRHQTQSPINQPALLQNEPGPLARSSTHQTKPLKRESLSPLRDEARTSPREKGEFNSIIAEPCRFADSNATSNQSPQVSPGSKQPNGQHLSRHSAPRPDHNTSQVSPLPIGPSNAPTPTSQIRGSVSLLSAPTRPRGGPIFNQRDARDSPAWMGHPSTRRGTGTYHNPPSGPRNGFMSGLLSHDSYRQAQHRHGSASNTFPRSQRFASYLSGITTIIAGGKILPSALDPVTERRLYQLEADKEKLLEQIAEKQKLKRSVLNDWSGLDRESVTGALKSELAESHLQRMSEEEKLGNSPAF